MFKWKPFSMILFAVLIVSILMGYVNAYTEPGRILGMKNELKLTLVELAQLQYYYSTTKMVASLFIYLVLAAISYRVGEAYKLTVNSGLFLIGSLYLGEVSGRLVGTYILQMQGLGSTTLPSMFFYTNYNYALFCLIGVLTANYVRESRQKSVLVNEAT